MYLKHNTSYRIIFINEINNTGTRDMPTLVFTL